MPALADTIPRSGKFYTLKAYHTKAQGRERSERTLG